MGDTGNDDYRWVRLAIDDSRWVGLVEGSRVALPFHHPAWSRLIADCYGYRAFVFGVADDGGRLLAGVPVIDVSTWLLGRKWVSLPFTDFCPPVVGVDGGL